MNYIMKKGTDEKESEFINIITTQIIAYYNLGTELEYLGRDYHAIEIY